MGHLFLKIKSKEQISLRQNLLKVSTYFALTKG